MYVAGKDRDGRERQGEGIVSRSAESGRKRRDRLFGMGGESLVMQESQIVCQRGLGSLREEDYNKGVDRDVRLRRA